MKLVAFFILALVGTSYASQALTKSLEKIHKDPTGAAILSMISLNLKMKTPISEIGDYLGGLRDDLLADSQTFESDTANENDRLTTAIANDQSLAAAYESAIATLNSLIESSRSSLETTQSNLAHAQKALGDEQQSIQDRDAAAAVDIPQFNQDLSDLADAIAACQEAVQKLNVYKQSGQGSATFIQMGTTIKDKITKATELMQGMRRKLAKHSNMFTPLIRELIDLSSTFGQDQDRANEIISLLNQLIDLLTDARSSTDNARATYETQYQEDQATANDNVAKYNAAIDQAQSDIENLTTRIADAQADLESTTQTANDNQAKLSGDQASLEALQADYNVRRTRYNSLISLVKQIISFYEQNLTGLDSFVNDQIDHSL